MLSSVPIGKTMALDIEGLLELHRAIFGTTRMEADDDPAEDDAASSDDNAGSGDDPADDSADDDKPLGPAGQKALDAEKDKRRAAVAQLREFKALGLTPAQIQAVLDAKKPAEGEDKPDADAIRREADREATQKANGRILRSEVRAVAAGKLADPADALKLLDLTKFEVDDDGNVDEAEIADAIADLIKTKPYLAAQGGKRFNGTADSGPRKEAPRKAASLQEAVTARLSAGGSPR